MEPMTLGSPSSSPANSPYLPPFLMGEQITSNNTLSPKAGKPRNISFAISPATSPQDVNRSVLSQKTLFGTASPPSVQTHNGSISGPPTQGLFDSLHADRNQIQSSTRQTGTLCKTSCNQSPFSTPGQNHQQLDQTQVTDIYMSPNSFESSTINSPIQTNFNQFGYCANDSINSLNVMQYPTQRSEFWVTVFGFPQSATTMILSHFSQCGTIIDKKFPSQSGNWVHLKYSCRLECDKALNYNEKILGNNIMLGVTLCKDKSIFNKENIPMNNKLRPLSQAVYKSAQNETAVITNTVPPQRSSGIMNKAMDLFFGW